MIPTVPADVTRGDPDPSGDFNDLKDVVDALRTNLGPDIDTTLAAISRSSVSDTLSNSINAELAYAERTTNFTSTNDNAALIHQNLITGLSITVTGIGRPVQFEFYANVKNSTANNAIGVGMVINGEDPVTQDFLPLGQVSSPSTTATRILYLPARIVVPDTVEWTIEIGVWGNSGTKTFEGSAQVPMWLAATQR